MKIKDKVLIVEDEQSISNFISMILTANGYDTIIVRRWRIWHSRQDIRPAAFLFAAGEPLHSGSAPFVGAVLLQDKLIPAAGTIEIDLRILRLDGEEK